MKTSRKVTVKVYCEIVKNYCNVVYEFETITTKLGRKISGPKGYYCGTKARAQEDGIEVENNCGCGQQYIKFLKNKNIIPKTINIPVQKESINTLNGININPGDNNHS